MSIAKRIRWLAKRARVMGSREILHRIREQCGLAAVRARNGIFKSPELDGLGFLRGTGARLPEWQISQETLPVSRDALLEGRWPALGFSWQWSADTQAWRRAPDTGRSWPASFAFGIDYRAGNPTGDVRVAWEPARLQHLVELALVPADDACSAQAVDLLERQLLSWVEHNPPWAGIHYISSMECALRLVAVCHAIDLARDRLTRAQEIEHGLTTLIASHAALISRRLSLYSSAGNHTIAESTGLIYAGVLFPEFSDSPKWRERGLQLLDEEMQRQVLDDGGGIEQAFCYLRFITDLAGLAVGLLEHQGHSVPARLKNRVARATDFLACMASQPGEPLPPIGDSDNGYALSSRLRLAMGEGMESGSARVFEQSGYSLARSSAAAGVEVLFDHGPMGMAPSFGHAHADALAVVLRRHGHDVLIDPGTGAYGGEPRFRNYFRSASAHNTVVVDTLDFAVQDSAFQWSSPVSAKLVRHEIESGSYRGLAMHDGYRERLRGLVHWRGLHLSQDGKLLIWDRIDSSAEHSVDWNWHCTPHAASAGGDWCLAQGMRLRLPDGVSGAALVGSNEPIGGWRSGMYGLIEPTVTIRASTRSSGVSDYVTLIYLDGIAWSPDEIEREVRMFRQWLLQS